MIQRQRIQLRGHGIDLHVTLNIRVIRVRALVVRDVEGGDLQLDTLVDLVILNTPRLLGWGGRIRKLVPVVVEELPHQHRSVPLVLANTLAVVEVEVVQGDVERLENGAEIQAKAGVRRNSKVFGTTSGSRDERAGSLPEVEVEESWLKLTATVEEVRVVVLAEEGQEVLLIHAIYDRLDERRGIVDARQFGELERLRIVDLCTHRLRGFGNDRISVGDASNVVLLLRSVLLPMEVVQAGGVILDRMEVTPGCTVATRGDETVHRNDATEDGGLEQILLILACPSTDARIWTHIG